MFKKMDKPLLFVSVILLVIGLVMVFSASNVTSFMKYQASPYRFFYKQLLFLIVSIVISLIALRFNTKTYGYISFVLLLVLIGFLVIVLVYGKITNQARSWINLFGGIKIQPSEFVKVATIVWMSFYCTISNNKTFVLISILLVLIVIIVMFILEIKDKKKKRWIKLNYLKELKKKKKSKVVKKEEKKEEEIEII